MVPESFPDASSLRQSPPMKCRVRQTLLTDIMDLLFRVHDLGEGVLAINVG